MKNTKFGPNGARVESFLGDVRTTDVSTWRTYVNLPLQPRGDRREAARASGDAPLSASVYAAISKESLQAFREIGISSEMFPDREARFLSILSDIEFACSAIAASERMEDRHVVTLLQPFADVGIKSAQAELARVTTDNDTVSTGT